MAKLDKMKYNIKEGHPFPMGVTREVDGINISVQAPEKMPVKFLVYKKLRYTGKEQPEKIPFPESGRMGKIICMKVEGLPESFAYHFQIGNEIETDSYAKYAKGKPDDFFYVALNSHWESHILALPNLPKGKHWYEIFSTEKEKGRFRKEKLLLENQKEFRVAPRSSAILVGV